MVSHVDPPDRAPHASDRPSISAVLPAYNEEANIERAVDALRAALRRFASDYEILIVDDGSSDRTGEIVDALAAGDGRVRAFHHRANRGYGAALWTGFSNASKELVFYTDSDNQFDVAEIGRLLDRIDENDIVVGYRVDRQDPVARRLFAWCFKQLIRVAFGLRLRDVDCAFKLFRRGFFDSIVVESVRFFVDAEMMAKARRLGLRVQEVGVRHFPRAAGSSTVRIRVIFQTLREAARIWWSLRRTRRRS
ncbi:MAG: glycosyltransferase family 2 protein [Planctomycetota bacterium]